MKKKLFLGFTLFASLGFMFFAVDSNDSSVFKASLLEESHTVNPVSAEDWSLAILENDESFFAKNIPSSSLSEFSEFLGSSALKMDIEVKKIANLTNKGGGNKDGAVFFSFFGVTNDRLDSGNYVYVTADKVLINPQGEFSHDAFNTALFTNNAEFPLFLDGEFLAISYKQEEVAARLISLSESEKNYILPGELFTLEQEDTGFDLSDIYSLESIKYGFTLTLTQ